MIWTNPPADQLTSHAHYVGAWIVSGDEIRAGDVLVLLGGCFRIDKLTPYDGTVLNDPDARDAWVEGRAFIPIQPGQRYCILPRPTAKENQP